MNDRIEITNFEDAHKIWKYVLLGGLVFAFIFLGLGIYSNQLTDTLILVCICILISLISYIALIFMEKKAVIDDAGLRIIYKYKTKTFPWNEIADVEMGKIKSTERFESLIIRSTDGTLIRGYGEESLTIPPQELVTLFNQKKQAKNNQ